MGLQLYQKNLLEKLKESLGAVLPIIGIVLVLCFSIAPIPNSVLMTFVVGAVLLIIGMMFFTLGAEMAMTPMGERIGTKLTNTRKISVVIVLCFILGFIITISEPDLQVLAEQVPSIPNYTLIIAVATGVGIFLVAAVLRMLFGIPLAHMLLILYPIIFILASIVPQDFLTVAFDSGGVTTGPMTVPFIMALGIGFSAVRSDKHAENDSFGLVALCSVGPILAVLLLGLLYHPGGSGYEQTMIVKTDNSVEMWQLFQEGLPYYMKEMLISLLPIILFFFIFQIVSLHLHKKTLVKIIIGIIYTYIGLVLFLTGVNVGFMPVGNYLGQVIAGLSYPDRLLYRKSGTSSICINGTGRRTDFRSHFRKSNGNESVHRSRILSGTGNGAGAYRYFDFVVSAPRIRSSPRINIFRAKNIHSNRI